MSGGPAGRSGNSLAWRLRELRHNVEADSRYLELTTGERVALLVAIDRFADQWRGDFLVKQETWAQQAGVSAKTILNLVGKAKASELLLVDRQRRPDGYLGACRYYVDPRLLPADRTSGNNGGMADGSNSRNGGTGEAKTATMQVQSETTDGQARQDPAARSTENFTDSVRTPPATAARPAASDDTDQPLCDLCGGTGWMDTVDGAARCDRGCDIPSAHPLRNLAATA
jgi:hypothetical protein